MADFPALPLWTDAYLADTRHLTTEQHGAYLLLLMEAWRRKDCALPNDDRLLARLVGVSAQKWCRMKPVLLEFWELSDGYLKQNRLKKERTYCEQRSQKQRERANTRWLKTNNSVDAVAVPEAMPDRCRSDAPTPLLESESVLLSESKQGITESESLSSTRVDSSDLMIAIWVDELPILSKPRKVTAQRRQKLNARLQDFCEGDLDLWRQACQRVAAAPHLCGDNDRGWTASLDWVIEPRNLTKILEGNYDARQPVERKPQREGTMDVARRILQRATAARSDRADPALDLDAEEPGPGGQSGGVALAVLPDGREVPLHGTAANGGSMDRGEPMVPVRDAGLRRRTTQSARPCDSHDRGQEHAVAGDQEQLDPDVGEALGAVVRATAWRP